VLVNKLAPRMRPATKLSHAGRKHRLVADVVVDHQRALIIAEEATGVLAAAAGAEVEHGDRRPDAAAVGKQVTAMGPALAGHEHAHWRLVGAQHRQRQQRVAHPTHQRLQRHPAGADPFGQGRTGDRDAAARVDRLLPAQRQLIHILGHQHLGQQTGRRDVAIDHRRRHRYHRDRLAAAAGVLRIDVATHEKLQRLAR
jgi:hypothetical protein